jgi:hypothetical protein
VGFMAMIVSIYAKVSGSLMVFGNLIDGVFWYLDDKVGFINFFEFL